MKKSLNVLIVSLLLVLVSLTQQSCVRSTPSNSELQRQRLIDSLTVSTAQNLTDHDAAAICFDMLNDCEMRLQDSTKALKAQREALPKIKRKAFWNGVKTATVTVTVLGILAAIL